MSTFPTTRRANLAEGGGKRNPEIALTRKK
jgi:hypothetical protein